MHRSGSLKLTQNYLFIGGLIFIIIFMPCAGFPQVKEDVLILDQFNHEIAPGETRAVREFLPGIPIYSFGFTNHPSAYIVKPGTGADSDFKNSSLRW